MRRGAARGAIATLACASVLLSAAAAGGAAGRARRVDDPAQQLSKSAAAAILVAPGTGQTLFGLHPHRELAIASATKLMTALVTLEHVHRLSTIFAQTDYYPASVDSQIGLVPGERMTVHDLLLALMLPSADDAAEDLAFNVGHGSTHAFVAMMNAQARRLGLRQTHYTTPSGLDTPGNYSSAADLARLAVYDVARYPFLRRIVALHSAVLRSGSHVRRVFNTNDLVGRVHWIDGIKTGHTLQAGYVLVASGHKGAMTLVSAVLGTPSYGARDADTLSLLGYGFSAFHQITPVTAGAVLDRVPVQGQGRRRAELVAGGAVTRVLPRDVRLHIELLAPRRLKGPLPRGAWLGTAVVTSGGRPIARVSLLLARAVPAPAGSGLASALVTMAELVGLVALIAAMVAGVRLARRGLRRSDRRRGRDRRTAADRGSRSGQASALGHRAGPAQGAARGDRTGPPGGTSRGHGTARR